MNKTKTVCVTGANGFIGSWVVRSLLDKNYTVHASIYPGTETSHLKTLPGATEDRLVVFESDILDGEGISKAIQGCEGVFHLALPIVLAQLKDPESELIRPAVQGTLNVLEASKRSRTVRRVVLTSSICALIPNPAWPISSAVDESSWTDIQYCQSHEYWYPISKALAEKTAWEYAQEHGMDIVAIHPSFVLGPLLQSSMNVSCLLLLQLLQGSDLAQGDMWLGAVDVRDVARAQLLLFETPTASGRYLCTNGIFQFRDFAQTLSELYSQFPVHRFMEETQPGLVGCKDASKRLLDLGMVFTPIEESIQDAVECLKQKGFLENKMSHF